MRGLEYTYLARARLARLVPNHSYFDSTMPSCTGFPRSDGAPPWRVKRFSNTSFYNLSSVVNKVIANDKFRLKVEQVYSDSFSYKSQRAVSWFACLLSHFAQRQVATIGNNVAETRCQYLLAAYQFLEVQSRIGPRAGLFNLVQLRQTDARIVVRSAKVDEI